MRPVQNQPRPLSELVRLLEADAEADTVVTAVGGLSSPRHGEDPPQPDAGDEPHTDLDAVMVRGITHDSRTVQPGDLYVALPGQRVHGADYCAQAVAAGAVAVVCDPSGYDRAAATEVPVISVPDPRVRLGEIAAWAYGRPAEDLLLIGTTGTSGKTTTSYLVESGFQAAGLSCGLVGTVETRIAGQRVESELTTPEATDLHALLGVMREQGVSAAAMEVSSHALALGRVNGVAYDVAIFTNLSQDHLDFHADLREYFETKARLFTPEFARVGVVNLDDRFGRALIDLVAGRIPITTFSASGNPDADWCAVDVELDAHGSTFGLRGPGGIEASGAVALPGPFNVANAVAAVVGLVEAGIPLDTALAGVAESAGVPGRMEQVDAGQNFTALVDYSHKPGAIEAVLTSLRSVATGQIGIVLGCGGERDRAKRPLMGEAAARLADTVVLTNDNPRGEDPLGILSAMLEGVRKVPEDQRARVTVEPDRASAIALAVERAQPGDVLVVAGKGHERGQYVAGEVLPFDDRAVVAEALRARVRA
ncbi:UDP-N-acetylmuramoyl-L-alanyl-D-glutamate--2,6-diaminopimelate ligase [Lipingzhangella sp. LS1_29]|uniref:UDP-N-acetylmuramoyl-L-alanyl-D-glutamate--2,6-diaminopimelate ligase n=1 Tax=Lipingzhangella rawalii TaxID=2055835 RepID=A0ABU2H284_9ACTN|nr:UDP-N-acetylmuramoyl-L-alanyl-D-glutamate--2,6-diaminopimelate ligase [Lipingzhangella rawalii]MDS1269403.1 UDP-N-acetylmuramoyl-L-alanyl-D-glutamate--2,6-diaminopimelate ligase [Lipingzhangella rawalii]